MLAGETRVRQGLPASVPYDPDGLPEPHPLELARDRDVLSSFVRPRGLARMAVFNAIAVAVSAGCAWLLAPAFSVGPGSDRDRGPVGLQRRRHRRRSRPVRRHCSHAGRKGVNRLLRQCGSRLRTGARSRWT